MVGGGWIDADEMVREGPVLYTFIQLSFKLDFRAEMAGRVRTQSPLPRTNI